MMMPTQLNTSSGSGLCAGDMGAVELAVHLFWEFVVYWFRPSVRPNTWVHVHKQTLSTHLSPLSRSPLLDRAGRGDVQRPDALPDLVDKVNVGRRGQAPRPAHTQLSQQPPLPLLLCRVGLGAGGRWDAAHGVGHLQHPLLAAAVEAQNLGGLLLAVALREAPELGLGPVDAGDLLLLLFFFGGGVGYITRRRTRKNYNRLD